MTLGARLIESEDSRKRAAREASGRALVDFFKVTCVAEVERAIAENRPVRWINPPSELRHLFAGRLSQSSMLDHENPRSKYHVEWLEIKSWAKDNGLVVETGYLDQRPQRVTKPWAEYEWKGRLVAARQETHLEVEIYKQSKSFFTSLADAIFGKR